MSRPLTPAELRQRQLAGQASARKRRGSQTFYHGTRMNRAIKIRKKGLWPVAATKLPTNFADSRMSRVYISKLYHDAYGWAEASHGHGKPTVVKIKLPNSYINRLRKNRENWQPEGSNWRKPYRIAVRGHIPSRYIKQLSTKKPRKGSK